MRITRLVRAVACGAILSVFLIQPVAGSGLPPDPNDYAIAGSDLINGDITGTPEGQAKIDSFLATGYTGCPVIPDQLSWKAYDLFKAAGIAGTVEPDYLVIRGDLSVGTVSALLDATTGERSLKITVDVEESGAFGDNPCSVDNPTPPYWQSVAHQCFMRLQSHMSWIDGCAEINALVGDSSTHWDYRQLHMWATAASKPLWTLREASVASVKMASYPGPWEWYDWDAKSDTQVGNCSTTTLTVTVGILSISADHDVCDLWDITKGSFPADFRNTWKGNARESERETAFMHAIKVLQGTTVGYTIEFQHKAGAF